MEDIQFNKSLKDALDSQLNEFTANFQTLIKDANNTINTQIKDASDTIENHIKDANETIKTQIKHMEINSSPTPTLTPTLPLINHPNPTTNTYASALINPPSHTNQKLAAHKGIKARHSALSGVKDSPNSHLNPIQLKTLLNNTIADLSFLTGKIWTVTVACDDKTIIEADSDSASNWLSMEENQLKICKKLGTNVKFNARNYKVIAYNVPVGIVTGYSKQ